MPYPGHLNLALTAQTDSARFWHIPGKTSNNPPPENEHQKRDLRIYPMNGYALNRIDLGFNLFYRGQASF